MMRVVQPRRKRPTGGTLTLMHLSDDNLRYLFELVDMPFALKLTCTALRDLHPGKTETYAQDVVHDVGLMVWAHACGMFEQLCVDQVAAQAAMTWPGGDDALTYMSSPHLYHHDLSYELDTCVLSAFAARTGCTQMLEWLGYGEEVKNLAALVAAVSHNQFECLKWMYERSGTNTEHFANPALLCEAVRKGHLEMGQWLVDHGHPVEFGNDTAALVEAARNGHVDCLQMMLRKGFKWSMTCYHRAMGPHDRKISLLPLATIQFIVTHGYEWDREVTWEEAVGGGHVDTVKWLVANDSDGHLFNTNRALWLAAEIGSIGVLELASDNGVALEPELCDCAAHGNQLETLKWLDKKGVVGTADTPYNAADRNNVEMMQYLHNHSGYSFYDSVIYFVAAAKGAVDVAEWCLSINVPLPTCADERQSLLEEALQSRSLPMLDWLLAHKCGTLREQYAQGAVWHNRPKLLQWLMDNDCPIDLDLIETLAPKMYRETDEVRLILRSWEHREREKRKRSPLQLLHSDD